MSNGKREFRKKKNTKIHWNQLMETWYSEIELLASLICLLSVFWYGDWISRWNQHFFVKDAFATAAKSNDKLMACRIVQRLSFWSAKRKVLGLSSITSCGALCRPWNQQLYSIRKAKNTGATPLYIGSEKGHDKIVRQLLEAQASVDKALEHNQILEKQHTQ